MKAVCFTRIRKNATEYDFRETKPYYNETEYDSKLVIIYRQSFRAVDQTRVTVCLCVPAFVHCPAFLCFTALVHCPISLTLLTVFFSISLSLFTVLFPVSLSLFTALVHCLFLYLTVLFPVSLSFFTVLVHCLFLSLLFFTVLFSCCPCVYLGHSLSLSPSHCPSAVCLSLSVLVSLCVYLLSCFSSSLFAGPCVGLVFVFLLSFPRFVFRHAGGDKCQSLHGPQHGYHEEAVCSGAGGHDER